MCTEDTCPQGSGSPEAHRAVMERRTRIRGGEPERVELKHGLLRSCLCDSPALVSRRSCWHLAQAQGARGWEPPTWAPCTEMGRLATEQDQHGRSSRHSQPTPPPPPPGVSLSPLAGFLGGMAPSENTRK